MRTIILFTGLLLSLAARSQTFFQCTSPVGDTVIYLFGVNHEVPKEQFQYDPHIDSLMVQCETVFTELYADDGSPGYATELEKIRQACHYAPGKGLETLLTQAELEEVFRYFKKNLGTRRSFFNRNLSLIPYFFTSQLEFKSGEYISTDHVLVNHAKKMQKQLYNLDNREILEETYRCLQQEYDQKWLLNYVRTDLYNVYQQQKKVYLSGDTSKIMKDITGGSEQENRVVIVNRNRQWQQVLLAHPGRRQFLICGLAHVLLPGGESLLDYYSNRGYRITNIPVQLLKTAKR